MILEQIKQLEIQRVGDTDEGIQAGIDEASLPFVFELVSKQLYSNPIGSVIREITSNCFDSHIEAGVDDPVVISKTYDQEEGYSIEFKDVGVGLSPDRVKSVFMNYFSSTKRGDNNQIGGFGIGSKTPLAYTDLFYIVTIFDKIKYEYVLHKGESKPMLELLSEEETEEHNGTTIKINIAESKNTAGHYQPNNSDTEKFKRELQFQLAYFDNVYFRNWGITNDYDIYEGKYFKFRSDIDQKTTYIHLCIGKVRYPIDFEKVRIKRDIERIPIAVKFEIGELQITPSREALRYDEKGIQLIKERVDLAIDEVLSIFERQNPEIETLKEYQSIKNSTPRITFNTEKNHVLNMWSYSGLSRNFTFKPLANLAVKKIPDNMFFMWECIGYIDVNGNYKEHGLYNKLVDNNFVLSNRYIIFEKNDKISKYTNLYINRQYFENSTVYLIKRRAVEYNHVINLLNIEKDKILGKAKIISEYIKIVSSIALDHAVGIYKNYRASEEWITSYKRSIIESTAAYIRKKNRKIFIRNISSGGKEVSVLSLQNRTGILIYGFREDKIMLQHIYNVILANKSSLLKARRKGNLDKAFMVVQIAQNVEKDVIGAKKTIYWKDVFKTKFFRKIETSIEIDRRLQECEFTSMEFRKKFIRDFEKDYEYAEKSIIEYRRTKHDTYIHDVIRENFSGRLIENMLTPINNFTKKHKDFHIPLSKALDNKYLDKEDYQEVANYLKYKGFKLKNEFYLKDKRQLEYEIELKKILNLFKNPQTNLLIYNQNLDTNGNEILNSNED